MRPIYVPDYLYINCFVFVVTRKARNGIKKNQGRRCELPGSRLGTLRPNFNEVV